MPCWVPESCHWVVCMLEELLLHSGHFRWCVEPQLSLICWDRVCGGGQDSLLQWVLAISVTSTLYIYLLCLHLTGLLWQDGGNSGSKWCGHWCDGNHRGNIHGKYSKQESGTFSITWLPFLSMKTYFLQPYSYWKTLLLGNLNPLSSGCTGLLPVGY